MILRAPGDLPRMGKDEAEAEALERTIGSGVIGQRCAGLSRRMLTAFSCRRIPSEAARLLSPRNQPFLEIFDLHLPFARHAYRAAPSQEREAKKVDSTELS